VPLAGGNFPLCLEQMVRIFLDHGRARIVKTGARGKKIRCAHSRRANFRRAPPAHPWRTAVQAAHWPHYAPRGALAICSSAPPPWAPCSGSEVCSRSTGSISQHPIFGPAGDSDEIAAMRQVLRDLTERDYILKLPDSTFPRDEEYVFKHTRARSPLQN